MLSTIARASRIISPPGLLFIAIPVHADNFAMCEGRVTLR